MARQASAAATPPCCCLQVSGKSRLRPFRSKDDCTLRQGLRSHHACCCLQVKQLSDESRLRYALLVVALASREDSLVVATMRELGLVVENCSHEFEVGSNGSGTDWAWLSLSQPSWPLWRKISP
jgi:hypothetical protein